MSKHDEIMQMLGKIDGRLDGIDQRLGVANGRLSKHDEEIKGFAAFKNELKGKINILVAVWGLIVIALGMIANHVWR